MTSAAKKNKGFTLIEITLVIAIAGFLLIIVFLAVSGAQKSRRDSQRKNDNSRILAQVELCAGNNRGFYTAPCDAAATYQVGGSYAPVNFNDPLSGTAYAVVMGVPGACAIPTTTTPATVTINIVNYTVTSRMCLEQGFEDQKNN